MIHIKLKKKTIQKVYLKQMCLYQGNIIIIIYATCIATAASFQINIIHLFTINYNDYED